MVVAKQFKSYRIETKSGKQYLVVNTGHAADGAPALKVREMIYTGVSGWSNYTKTDYRYGEPKWIRADVVVKRF